jgi:hypothetical protein
MSVRIVAIGTFLALFAGNVLAAERVGSTIEAQSTVSGEGAVGKRVIARADPIYRDERLRSNLTGLGQFQLGDGTKLVLGRNASLVIDRYVIGGGSKAKTITLKLISGSARFVTGASDKRAYRILTPQGTIGVRGTAFDLTVRNGKTHLLLLSKNSQFPPSSIDESPPSRADSNHRRQDFPSACVWSARSPPVPA